MLFFDWVSCETFAERVSRALDGKLAWHEKPAYYFRLAVCMTSRRFRRQMCALEEISKKKALYESQEETGLPQSVKFCLSGDALVRIEDALKDKTIH
jgi:hypothetical protein